MIFFWFIRVVVIFAITLNRLSVPATFKNSNKMLGRQGGQWAGHRPGSRCGTCSCTGGTWRWAGGPWRARGGSSRCSTAGPSPRARSPPSSRSSARSAACRSDQQHQPRAYSFNDILMLLFSQIFTSTYLYSKIKQYNWN